MGTQASSVKFMSVRVPQELHERFRLAAEASHRSLEGEVKNLMEKRVRRFESEMKKAA